MSAYRLGSWAAGAVALIGVAYIAALITGFVQVGFDAPIGDPVLAIMEVLTLLSSAAIVVALAAVHQHSARDEAVFAVLALAFGVIFAGITSTVHFVGLSASRQLGSGAIVWPSAPYAAELLAWDWFLGLALICVAQVFGGGGAERLLRGLFRVAGALAVVGVLGPIMGDMRLQRVGIVGYALVMPVAFLMLARYFRDRDALTE